MSEMPLEPDSPDDESHSSESWQTDGGSHLEMIFDRTLWSASDIDLARARLCIATDVTCEMFAWPKLEVGGLFCGDDRIRDLNNMFRGMNKPTNVLSFPAGDDDPGGDDPGNDVPEDEVRLVAGEIAMAFETLHEEARRDGKSAADHMTHLWVHALLHLMGHDHEDEDEAEAMEAGEVRVLARLGIENPYAEAAQDAVVLIPLEGGTG
jgi:probable rRNA maturation factor